MDYVTTSPGCNMLLVSPKVSFSDFIKNANMLAEV